MFHDYVDNIYLIINANTYSPKTDEINILINRIFWGQVALERKLEKSDHRLIEAVSV